MKKGKLTASILAILLIVCSSVLLSVENIGEIKFEVGSIFILLACVCWGFENNITKRMFWAFGLVKMRAANSGYLY